MTLATIPHLFGFGSLCASLAVPPDVLISAINELDIVPAALFEGSQAFDMDALETLRAHFAPMADDNAH